MNKQHYGHVTAAERGDLSTLIRREHASTCAQTHARMLLLADCGQSGPRLTDREIAAAVGVEVRTVARVRSQFAREGLATTRHRRPRFDRHPRKLEGAPEAQLIALVCSDPPPGQVRWSLRLLSQRLVELQIVAHIAPETVRQTLKKTALKPWLKQRFCIPATANAAFVAAREDVLGVDARPRDPARPLVCFDEAGNERQTHVRSPLPRASGHPARADSAYRRHGSANLFLAWAPHLGWRHVAVTAQRTQADWAAAMRTLVAVQCPAAARIVLGLANRTTHPAAARSATFPPAAAKRSWAKRDLHYTPKHGSWLTMAELELRVLARQCLRQRIPAAATLATAVAAWAEARNAAHVRLDWRFTTTDARIKLSHLYPIPQPVTN